MKTPKHLGGHLNKTHVDEGVLSGFLTNVFIIKSMLDIGCGPAGMEDIAKAKGLEYQGVDGDPTLKTLYPDRNIFLHDFTTGKITSPNIKTSYDLGWSTEFLEHVEEKYVDNYMDLFKRCKYVVVTHALPGDTGGHHHVNLKPASYWKEVFDHNGFTFDDFATNAMRAKSTMTKNFMRKTGMFFYKR